MADANPPRSPLPYAQTNPNSYRVRATLAVALVAGARAVALPPRRSLAIALAVCIIIFSACAAGPPPPSRPVSSPLLGAYHATSPASRSPRGRLVFADRHVPDTVNPLFNGVPVDFEVSAALWAAPVVFDDHFRAQPDQLTEVPLPENGDVQDGGRTIIMRLRHDLRWSDGQPLLARDFQYWWQLDQNPQTGALNVAGYDQIASIDTPDPYTVVLHMKHPFGPYLLYLPYAAPFHAWGSLRPIDLQNEQQVFLVPTVTDGPYKLARFVNGQSYTLVPNTNYRSTTFHGPYLAQLLFRAYPDLASLRAAIQARQVDVTEGYMEYELSGLSNLPAAVTLLETPAAAYEHLDFNLANPDFQDVRVRRAIQQAIDICGLLRNALRLPDCSRALSQVEPRPSLYYDPSIQPAAYDPAEAKQLLIQAGWLPGAGGTLTRQGHPFVIRLVTTSDNPLRSAVARYIQRALRTVGIQVNIQYASPGSLFAIYTRGGILATGNYDLAMFGYQNAPDPDDEYGVFHSSQIPSAAQPLLGNYGRVADPAIDAALNQGRNSASFLARVTYYHRFLERLAEQVYLIPLYTGINSMTIQTNVRNVLPNPNVLMNNWNIADWWVSG